MHNGSVTNHEGGTSDQAHSRVDPAELDVAVAHWHVNAWGGAEYLVTRLAETLGCDTIYTVGVPDPDKPNPYGNISFYDVTADLSFTSLRKLQSRVDRVFEYATWEDVDWRRYGPPDILITSGSTTRSVITPGDTLHINYCHSPPRWLYDRYHDRKDSVLGVIARPLVRYLRLRDATVDLRVDHYFANSPIVARRICKFYNRESTMLYPPVDIADFVERGDDGYYLHIGRLDEEKGVPAIVEAFDNTDYRLVFAGGRGDVDNSVLERISSAQNLEYRGFVHEAEKTSLLSSCRAVVFNGVEEDFGIVPVEANASKKPCLVRDDGFPALFITNGENGYHHDGTATGIRESVERFERHGIAGDPQSHAQDFSHETFRKRLHANLADWYAAHQLS